MALTIAVCGLKGGVGKSTIVRQIATALDADGHGVLIIDADVRNTTCLQWAQTAADAGLKGPPVVGLDAKALRRDLASHAARYDVILIDTAAQLGPEAGVSMALADLVLLPTRPDADDVRSLAATIELFEQAQAVRPELRARIVLNAADRTVVTRTMRAHIETLSVPLLSAELSSSVVYREANAGGMGAMTIDPKGNSAREVRRLTKAVLAAAVEVQS
jgi:chromosome partitioning protein